MAKARTVADLETNGQSIVTIDIPIDHQATTTDFGLHIEFHLDVTQANAIRKVKTELDKRQAKLRSGKRVVSHHDAIKYILEAIEQ